MVSQSLISRPVVFLKLKKMCGFSRICGKILFSSKTHSGLRRMELVSDSPERLSDHQRQELRAGGADTRLLDAKSSFFNRLLAGWVPVCRPPGRNSLDAPTHEIRPRTFLKTRPFIQTKYSSSACLQIPYSELRRRHALGGHPAYHGWYCLAKLSPCVRRVPKVGLNCWSKIRYKIILKKCLAINLFDLLVYTKKWAWWSDTTRVLLIDLEMCRYCPEKVCPKPFKHKLLWLRTCHHIRRNLPKGLTQ